MKISVRHTVASRDPKHGGPSRSVPALVSALGQVGVEAGLAVWDEGRSGRSAESFTLLHDHGLWLRTNHRVARESRRRSVPFVISPRGMLEPWALNHRQWKKRAAWRLYQRRDLQTAAIVHVTSEAEAESVRWLGLHNPIAMIPNGVDLPADRPRPSRNGFRRALFLSRVHPKKGLSILVSAWSQVRPPGWELVIAGPDEDGHWEEIEKQSLREGLNREIRFVGPVEDEAKWTLYHSADLFVLPTHSENFGLVVAEALAAGVPVITTKGAPWAALESQGCGWWVDVGVAPLASALARATALSDEDRQEMGRRGRQLVEERYAWGPIAREMRGVYEWALGRGPAPACLRFD